MAEERRPVQFFELLQSLVDGEVDFIVVGGVAAVLEGAPVSTFDLETLIATKEAANRPKDRATLDLLRQILSQRRNSSGEQ
jgi:hypothetical protein